MSGLRRGVLPLALPLAATAAAALGYRLVILHQLRRTPALLHPVLDAEAHLEWARGFLAGAWPGDAAFFRAPGYVWALAGELSVLGDNPERVAVFQLLAGVVLPLLTALLAYRLSGIVAAWVAGLGAGLYPMFPFFDVQLLVPVLALPILAGAALATLAAAERGGRGRIAAAGLAWGLAGICRPPLLLAAAVLPLALWVRAGRGNRGASVGLAAGAILLLPLLVTARNAAVGDPVFLASQGGLNFYLGNGKAASGVSATFPDRPRELGYRMIEAASRLAEEKEGRALSSGEVSAYYLRRAGRDIVADPGRWLRLLAKKAFLFWTDREIPNNHDPVLFADVAPALRWTPGWAIWAPLGVVGFALGRRKPGVRLAGGIVLAVLAGCVLFFVNARFRIPAAPFLIALGAGGAVELGRRAHERRDGRLAVWAGALLALGLLVRWNPYGIPKEPWVLSYVLVGEAESARREPVRALRWIERGLEIEPGLYAGRIAQIDLLRRMGRLEEARGIAAWCVERLPDDAALRSRYGTLLDLTGDPRAALEQVEAAIRLDPAYDPARVDRAIVLARLGESQRAEQTLREFLGKRPRSREAERAREVLAAIAEGLIGPEGAGRGDD